MSNSIQFDTFNPAPYHNFTPHVTQQKNQVIIAGVVLAIIIIGIIIYNSIVQNGKTIEPRIDNVNKFNEN